MLWEAASGHTVFKCKSLWHFRHGVGVVFHLHVWKTINICDYNRLYQLVLLNTVITAK